MKRSEFRQLISECLLEVLQERCWTGYKPVTGKKPYEKGSCEKKTVSESFDSNELSREVGKYLKTKIQEKEPWPSFEDFQSVLRNNRLLSQLQKYSLKQAAQIAGDIVLIVSKKHLTEGKCTKPNTKKTSSTRKDKKWMKCSNGKKIHWGDPNAKVTGKSGNTKRKKNFRARHNCSSAKPGTPKYQACKDW